MTSVSILLIFVGVFIIINANNIKNVFQGNATLGFQGATPAATATRATGTNTFAAGGGA
jgi:hypothetical protein